MRPALALFCTTLVMGGALAAPAPMTVHYVPGVALTADGVPNLPMGASVALWARQAGLPLRWEPVPLKRSLLDLRANRAELCVLGAFRTRERLQFARFSLPIYQEEQQVFLAPRPVAAQLRALPDARTALMDTRFKLLVFDGVAYGEQLDQWIAQRPEPPLRAGASSAHLAPMLVRGHADLLISVASELRELRAAGEPGADSLEAVLLPGMPAPPTRHLACSLRTPPAWLARFDAAVRGRPVSLPQ